MMLRAQAVAVDVDRVKFTEGDLITLVVCDDNLAGIENERIGRSVFAIEMRRTIGAIADVELAKQMLSETVVARSTLDAAGLVFVVERLRKRSAATFAIKIGLRIIRRRLRA